MRHCTKTPQIYDKKKKTYLVYVLVLHKYKFKMVCWFIKIDALVTQSIIRRWAGVPPMKLAKIGQKMRRLSRW